ncbi:MAG: sigma 54-interacting transcriptional regulator [Nitrospirales bacterium]
MNPTVLKVLLASTCVVLCTAVSFGFSHLFPQGEQELVDWQLSHFSSPPIVPSIVLVRAEEKSEALCGEGRWNLPVLEASIGAFHQAGASVIAPLLDIHLPVASECGGLAGFVKLSEMTKQVGTVVYPDSVPPPLVQAAVRTGHLETSVNDSGTGGGYTFPAASLRSSRLPFGIAAATLAEKSVPVPTEGSFLSIPSTMEQPDEFVFPTYSFTEVWKLVQAGDEEKLVQLFQDKIVFFYAGSSIRMNPSGSQVSLVPPALVHAKMANAYLTHAWVVPAPFFMAFFLAVSVGLVAWGSLQGELSLGRYRFMSGVMVVLLVSALILLGFWLGWIWPLFSMGLAVGMTFVGIGAWKLWLSRSTVHREIDLREQQLTQLEHELSGKQHHVRLLEERLSEAQHQSDQSGTVIEELQIAQDASRSQLNSYHDEVQETRQKIERLQEELYDLRQQMPVIPSVRSLEADDQELIQECQAFQIETRDQAVLRLFQNLKKAAATQVPILLLGETGTGKEIFAKAAHALSPRRDGPFISVNMAAIRAELFEGELFGHVKGAFTGAVGRTGFLESAHQGTLFLDEVGDLPLDLQAKLLRFLEDGGFHRVGQSVGTHVDVRIVAATNRDLQDEVRAGRYREDLYYRLRSIVLTLPPLRARSQADHVLLAQSFLRQCAHSQHRTNLAFTQGALDAMMAYRWPGNIRELRQTIAQAVALANGSVITQAELNLEGPKPGTGGGNWVKDDLGQREDLMVLECLRRHNFDMQATAATLGWDRGTVTQRLKGLGFQALRDSQGDVHAAAIVLAGNERFVRVVEGRLREYTNNLVPPSKHYGSVEEAIADCRKRFRNLPERHLPAVEELIHARFAPS